MAGMKFKILMQGDKTRVVIKNRWHQRKVSNNCKKIEFQLFSFLEIYEFLFHTFVCHHILMKWFIFGRLCLCYCWNIAKNRNLLLFLWFQKIGPFKMYMALRTLQKNFMSPILDNNSSTYNLSYVRHSTYDLMNTNIRRRDGSKERVYLQNLHFFSGRITVLYQSKQRPQFANVVVVRTKNIFQLNAAARVNEFCNDFPQ